MSKKKKHDDHKPEESRQEQPQNPRSSADAGRIDLSDVKSKQFPVELPSDYRVVISDDAFKAIKAHAQDDTSVELCGVLVGELLQDDTGPYLVVHKSFEGVATRRTGERVTFTHETWEQIHKKMQEEAPDLSIVGWYHTHPGFGIFLSEMDQFIQDNFFNLSHQVAFVYDPISEEKGLFIWKDGRSNRLRRYWLANELRYDTDAEQQPKAKTEPNKTADSSTSDFRSPLQSLWAKQGETQDRMRELPPWAWVASVGIILFAAFWLGGRLSIQASASSSEQRARALEQAVHIGLLRDGLGRDLDGILSSLNRAHRQLENLKMTAARSAAGEETEGQVQPQGVAASDLNALAELIQNTHTNIVELRDYYNSTGRLTAQMRRASAVPDDVTRLKEYLAVMMLQQAQDLLREPDPAIRRQVAAQFMVMAVDLDPRHKTLVQRHLMPLLKGAEGKQGMEKDSPEGAGD